MANYSKTKSVFPRSKQAYLLGLMQLATVLFLLATITGTCQRTCKSNLKIKPKYVDLTIQPKIRLPPKFKSILSHLWLCDLIFASGDVHPNPGPRQAGPPTYPCGTCQRPVKNRDKAISCDECNLWHHINCVGTSPSTYHISHPSRSICSLVLQTLRHSKLYTHILQRRTVNITF